MSNEIREKDHEWVKTFHSNLDRLLALLERVLEKRQPPTGKEEAVLSSQRRISSRQRKLSLDEYRKVFLQVPRIEDRKPVFVSGEVRDRLDEFVRRLGGRKMSVSGLLENIARQHLEIYSEDFEQWRKL